MQFWAILHHIKLYIPPSFCIIAEVFIKTQTNGAQIDVTYESVQ